MLRVKQYLDADLHDGLMYTVFVFLVGVVRLPSVEGH